MSSLAPEIQSGGGSVEAALYGGAVRVRRGRRRRGGAEDIENMGRGTRQKFKGKTKTEEASDATPDPVAFAIGKKALVTSEKSSRTYTLVKTVMSLMFAKDGGEYKIPDDTFRVANEKSNCTATKKDWAKAVKANFTTPTDDTIADLGIKQRAFAECMYNAIIKARGTGSPEQKELAEILAAAESRDEEGVQMIDNQISFIMSLNVGFMPSQLSDEEGMVGGGEDEDEVEDEVVDDENFDQTGGMNYGGLSASTKRASSSPASSSAGSGAASAAEPVGVRQSVLVQVAAAPSLQGQLAIAQQEQGGGAAVAAPAAAGAGGPAAAVIAAPQAPNVSYELAAAAFRLFLSPFRSCYRTLPEASSITARLNSAAEAVENRRDILPATIAVSTAAAGLLMPGAVGGALTGAANTLDAVNSVIPSGLSILTGAAGNTAAVGSLAVSAGRLGASAASVYVASRAVGALTNTGVRCAAGAARLAVRGVGEAGDTTVRAIEGAPDMAVAASAPAISAAASAAGPALMAAPGAIASAAGSAGSAAMRAGRRAGQAVKSAFAGIRGGGGGGSGEQIERLAIANADAVEAVMDAPDVAAAMEAAAAGGASVRAAISAAGGSGAYAESAGNAIAQRLNVLAGKKRSRAAVAAEEAAAAPAPAPAAADAAPGAGAAPVEEGAEPASNRPKTDDAPKGGGCPTCGSHGGSRKKRKSKAKKSRKQKKRASYRRRRKMSKSHSPSEAIYASPPVPEATVSPRMESSGPPVRS